MSALDLINYLRTLTSLFRTLVGAGAKTLAKTLAKQIEEITSLSSRADLGQYDRDF